MIQHTSTNRKPPITQANNSLQANKRTETLLCFSHLRWDFVYQRPQHLMSRFATVYNVLFIEEPIHIDDHKARLTVHEAQSNLYIVQPHIPRSLTQEEEDTTLFLLLNDFLLVNNYDIAVRWYFTPMMIQWTKHLNSKITVYDCMDELATFKNAPAKLKWYEQELMLYADLVFTGGKSLYEAKRLYHESVYLFPSSVDIAHFKQARKALPCPVDQMSILGPRIGFYGVLDERLDTALLEDLAKNRPDWNLIIIGPIVKISYDDLPQLPNIHYLGPKTYEELPYYLSGWDVAFLPFAINESTKFISPTKTPEYLAGGKPVVSTPITDIVSTYKNTKVVHIANPKNIEAFAYAIESALEDSKTPERVYREADTFLNNMSWDRTFVNMNELMLAMQSKKEAV